MTTSTIAGDVDYAAHGQGYGRQRRPEAFLDLAVRRSQSAWSFVPDDVQARIVQRLGAELASGEWDRKHGAWRARPFFEGSLRGIVSRPPR